METINKILQTHKMIRMISNIEPIKAALISIISASIGTINKYLVFNIAFFNVTIDTALQRTAWLFAILAASVAIINGAKSWFKKTKQSE